MHYVSLCSCTLSLEDVKLLIEKSKRHEEIRYLLLKFGTSRLIKKLSRLFKEWVTCSCFWVFNLILGWRWCYNMLQNTDICLTKRPWDTRKEYEQAMIIWDFFGITCLSEIFRIYKTYFEL